MIKQIAVYCGAGAGTKPIYRQGATILGNAMAARGIGLVFGGGGNGMMGTIADAVVEAGGRTVGVAVFNKTIDWREVTHTNLTELHEVADMHTRKAMMFDLADGFIAMPGGYGTLDELFEIITWAKIGLHHKPIALYNIAGYFDPLLATIRHAENEGFIPEENYNLVYASDSPDDILDRMLNSNAH